MTHPLIIAHRGFSARYVENTLSAYHVAVGIGADIVETDARLSIDGAVFACHDATLIRVAGDPRAISDMTSKELEAVALPDGERLAPLRQTLAEIAPKRPILIDVKTPDFQLIDAVVRDIRASQAAGQVWVGMRDAAQMERARSLEPGLSLLAFLPDYTRAEEFERAGAHAFRVWESDVAKPAALALLKHKQTWITMGGQGTPCEVGDTTPERLAAILAYKPGGILLNDPALMAGPRPMAPWQRAGRGAPPMGRCR